MITPDIIEIENRNVLVQTEMEPSAHSGAERLWIEVAKERRRRGASNILRNLQKERENVFSQ